MSFFKSYPHLHRWIEIEGTIEIGSDYNRSGLLVCSNEGGEVYESPDDVTDLDTALDLADAAIHDWLAENSPEDLEDLED